MIATDLSFGAYVETYLRGRTVSADYAELLRRRVHKFEEWLGAPIKLRELSDDLVSDFLADLIERQGLSKTTAKNYRANLLSLWRDAYEARLTDRRPERVKTIRSPAPEPEAWTHDEIRRLLDAAAKLPGTIKGTNVAVSAWTISWARGAYDSGLRCSDQFRLTRDRLAADGTFSVSQGKTGYAVRCRFSPATMEAIAAMGWDGPTVWPWGARREQFFVLQRKVVKAAGLTGTFKRLRASAGSYRELASPGTGHQLLGHRDSGVFRRHYEDRRITRPHPLAPPPLD